MKPMSMSPFFRDGLETGGMDGMGDFEERREEDLSESEFEFESELLLGTVAEGCLW